MFLLPELRREGGERVTKKKGAVITCDRCGAQAFGDIVAESGVGVPRWPEGWKDGVYVMHRAYCDLCPTCAAEYTELSKKWWEEADE